MQISFQNLALIHNELKEELFIAFEKVLNSNQFILGAELETFEIEWAQMQAQNFCIGVSSGLEAIKISLLALGIQKNDEVIMPANGFIATAFAVLQIGAIPVLADVEAHTMNVSVQTLEKARSPRTKCVIPVHLYGLLCPMKEIAEWAKEYNIIVIEDAAQAHLAQREQYGVGTYAQAAAQSFYPTKNIGALGDAGCILSNSQEVNDFSKAYRNYGGEKRFQHLIEGSNARLDALQAAFLNVKMKYIQQWNQERNLIAARYNQAFQEIEQLSLPLYPEIPNLLHTYHLYVLKAKRRDELAQYLTAQGIGYSIQYPDGLHQIPALKGKVLTPLPLPITEQLCKEIISLPCYVGLTVAQQGYIIEKVKAFYAQ